MCSVRALRCWITGHEVSSWKTKVLSTWVESEGNCDRCGARDKVITPIPIADPRESSNGDWLPLWANGTGDIG